MKLCYISYGLIFYFTFAAGPAYRRGNHPLFSDALEKADVVRASGRVARGGQAPQELRGAVLDFASQSNGFRVRSLFYESTCGCSCSGYHCHALATSCVASSIAICNTFDAASKSTFQASSVSSGTSSPRTPTHKATPYPITSTAATSSRSCRCKLPLTALHALVCASSCAQMHMKVEWDWQNMQQSLTALVRRHVTNGRHQRLNAHPSRPSPQHRI